MTGLSGGGKADTRRRAPDRAFYQRHRRLRRDRPPQIDPVPAGIAVVVLPVTADAPADASWVALGAMDLVAGRLRKAKLAQ